MSVINQMLRDLEKRQQSPTAASQPQPAIGHGGRRWPYGVLLLGTALGALVVLLFWRLQPAPQLPPAAAPALASPPLLAAVKPAVVAAQPAAAAPAVAASANLSAVPPPAEAQPAAQPAAQPENLDAQPASSLSAAVDEPAVDPLLLREVPSVAEAEAAAMAEEQAWLALAAEPQPAPARGSLKVTATRMSASELAERAGQQAERAYDKGRFDEALGHYREALALAPQRLEWRRRLAELQLARGDLAATGDTLAEGLRYQPDDVGLRLALAHLLQEQGQYAEALATLALATPGEAEALRFHQLRGGLAQQLKQWPLALESYQQLVSRSPGEARYWLGLALANDGQGDYPRAAQAFGRALALQGLSPAARSYAQQRLGQLEGRP